MGFTDSDTSAKASLNFAGVPSKHADNLGPLASRRSA